MADEALEQATIMEMEEVEEKEEDPPSGMDCDEPHQEIVEEVSSEKKAVVSLEVVKDNTMAIMIQVIIRETIETRGDEADSVEDMDSMLKYHQRKYEHLLSTPEMTHFFIPSGGHLALSSQAYYEESVIGMIHISYIVYLWSFAKLLVENWCKYAYFGSRLQIVGPPLSYYVHCKPEHEIRILESFSLGSFLDWKTYLDHFSEAKYLYKDKSSIPSCKFEHDRKQMEIRFYRSVKDGLRIQYKLKMTYDHLRVVVGDFEEREIEHKTHKGSDYRKVVCLYFEILAPPSIWEATSGDKDTTYKRVGEVSFEPKYEGVLGNSSVISLRFPNSLTSREAMYEIIGRFRMRAHNRLAVFFGPVDTRPPRQSEPQLKKSMEILTHRAAGKKAIGGSFPVFYALDALFRRGYRVKDHLKGEFGRDFVDLVGKRAEQQPELCQKALEQLLSAVDELKNVDIRDGFERIWEDLYREAKEEALESVSHLYDESSDEEEMEEEGTEEEEGRKDEEDLKTASLKILRKDLPDRCVLVRKVVVTPTRMHFVSPEVMMGNRVIRNFHGDFALRCVFRDEDGQKMVFGSRDHGKKGEQPQTNEPPALVRERVERTFLEGIWVGGRQFNFLAWSNSQLRDHGCYFWADTKFLYGKRKDEPAGIQDIRAWMGDFGHLNNVPKRMSRMALSFTQAQSVFELNDDVIDCEPDVLSTTRNSETGEFYIFSDGIGRVSVEFAKKIAENMKIRNGIPSAFQLRFRGYKGMLTVDSSLPNAAGKHVIFRDSMKKFVGAANSDLEIVKYSSPASVYLNRPLIMILDQTSNKQSAASHERIRRRIHKLLEDNLFLVADMLFSQKCAVEAINSRIPVKFNAKKLHVAGFRLTTEPFFRSLLLSIHAYHIRMQLTKLKVEIPAKYGRTMYGILDETGTLRYGEVFVQWTNKEWNGKRRQDKFVLLKGKVMVTKNPCVVPGDVRILEAVDRAELRDKEDVIVFPRYGDRPHTDEMAGSDLDGDEYSVYKDPELMLDGNEEPMEFDKRKQKDQRKEITELDIARFFLRYMCCDNVGQIASRHLVRADYEPNGIFSEVCMELARKSSHAVDFAKTGRAADPFEKGEQIEKYPDYMKKEHKPSYKSQWILGEAHRKVKRIEELIQRGQFSIKHAKDPHLEVEDWREEEDRAKALRDRYAAEIQTLLDTYGIPDEASLVSGHISDIRNRISDGDKEDFSFYNSEKVVELRYQKIFQKYRAEFFAGLPDSEREDFSTENEIDLPSDEARKKACAWYEVTYGEGKEGGGGRCLSFPWVVWDVLTAIKRKNIYSSAVDALLADPLLEHLNESIENHAKKITPGEIWDIYQKSQVLARYCERYDDLIDVLAVISQWFNAELKSVAGLGEVVLFLLYVKFCLDRLRMERSWDRWNTPDLESSDESPMEVSEEEDARMSNSSKGIIHCCTPDPLAGLDPDNGGLTGSQKAMRYLLQSC